MFIIILGEGWHRVLINEFASKDFEGHWVVVEKMLNHYIYILATISVHSQFLVCAAPAHIANIGSFG